MIFRGPDPELVIPNVSLSDFVFQHAAWLSAKPELIDGATRRTLTYGQLADRVRRTAVSLVAARVAPYKKVRRIEFVEQIPKSPSGTILRRVLVERERAALLTLV